MMDGDRIEQIFQPFPSSSSFLSLFTQVFDSMPPLSLYFIYHPRVYMNRRNSNAESTFQFFFFPISNETG